MTLWFAEKVEVIEFHDLFVHSSNTKFRLPSIIRLKSYISKTSRAKVKYSKQNVILRDLAVCQYCGKHCSNKECTIDHVIPISKQGPESWDNVVVACRECNQKKANRTPAAAGMPLLKEPVRPNWLSPFDVELFEVQVTKEWHAYLKLKIG